MVVILELRVDPAHVGLFEQLLALVSWDLRDVIFVVILAFIVDSFDQPDRLLAPVVKFLLIGLHGGTLLEHALQSHHLTRVALLFFDPLLDLDAVSEHLGLIKNLAFRIGERICKLFFDLDLLRSSHAFSYSLSYSLSLKISRDPFDPLFISFDLLLRMLFEFLKRAQVPHSILFNRAMGNKAIRAFSLILGSSE